MSWNTGSPGYGPPPDAPGGYSFHTAQHHGGNYPPPPGPPPSQWGYSPPLDPPPHSSGYGYNEGGFPAPGPPMGLRGYPGESYHHNQAPPLHDSWESHRTGYGNPGSYHHAPQPHPVGEAHMPPSHVQYYGPQFEGQNSQKQQPYFQYSMCNGKKKALCIGINYVGTSSELGGCVNDARNVQRFLIQRFGYREEDIVMLTDDSRNPAQLPTRANIIRAMQWLVRDARPHDSLFFHYSGHGGQVKDEDGDEDDGYDETIFPVDFETNGQIVDDELHFTMVKPLPAGCRLTAIFDCCHSGSALDLPYMYTTEGKIKEPNLLAEAGQGLLQSGMAYMKGDTRGALTGLMSLIKQAASSNPNAEEYAKRTRTSPADAISWSGCKDNQTSADTVEAGQSTGAMSFAFIEALSNNPQQTYQQLLVSIREILSSKYSQKPQLSSSHPMDTNIVFIC